ncbi:MAG: hypothetical protein WBP18_18585 [Paracoccaceae bacterium]
MVYLFLGMIFSGIDARLTLISHRGGFFLAHEASKSMATVILELLGFLAGIAAFIASFMLFAWWVPLVALAIGYWFVAPAVVNRSSFPAIWAIKGFISIGAISCSTAIILKFFDLL